MSAPPTRVAAAAVLSALATALIVQHVRASASPAPPAASVVVSPLAGTPDADPATQVSFLGAPASRLRDVTVVGSLSGRHSGRLAYYSTHTGGSFLPSHPFTPGETVTVSATVVGSGAPAHVGTSFTIAAPYTLPTPTQPGRAPTPPAGTVLRFHSRPDLAPPVVNVTTPAVDPTLGDIFVSPDNGPAQAGPMIVSPSGQLVWFKPLPWGTTAFNLNVQRYHGAPVLTWWQGQIVDGHGQGVDEIESSRYTPIATIHAGNGLYADLHAFVISPQNTAWITAFAPVHADLRSVGGARDGVVSDGVAQEIDIKTGLVMFQWNALAHVPPSDSYAHASRSPSSAFDYFHPNSIDALPGGDLLISARNTWATYLISPNGSVIWQLGGKRSSFSLGPGVRFAWQHDAVQLADGTIGLFDNEAAPSEATQSRVVDVALDTTARTATLVRQLTYPGKPLLSPSQGDLQPLANGDTFVGWGQSGEVSELSPADALTFDMHFTPPTNSYRAFRYAWNTQPGTTPALAVSAAGTATQLYASWNGATGVASWRLLDGAAPTTLAAVGTYPSQGFETTITAPTAAPYFQVQALATNGAALANSAIVKR